jgi:hypothetical protein
MRSLALATLAAAFAVTVSAKFSFGSCKDGVPQWTYDDYLFDLDERVPYSHSLIAMDIDFFDTFELLKSFGFKLNFDPLCEDLATISPWKEIAKE